MGTGSSCCRVQSNHPNDQIVTDLGQRSTIQLPQKGYDKLIDDLDSKSQLLDESQVQQKKRSPDMIIKLQTKELTYLSQSQHSDQILYTPGFNENSIYQLGSEKKSSKKSFSSSYDNSTLKLAIINAEESNQIILVADFSPQNKHLLKQNTAFKPGNSPMPKFNSKNKLVIVSQDNEKLRSLSAEQIQSDMKKDSNAQDPISKQVKPKARLSRSFTTHDIHQIGARHRQEQQNDKDNDLISSTSKKSNLKANLKYHQKRNLTYKEANSDSANGKKKVRFDQVLQQQQQRSKYQ